MSNRSISVRNKKLQRGQGMTEYIIMVALIAIAAITVFTYFGQTTRQQVAGMATELGGKNANTQINAAQTAASNASSDADKTKNMGTYNDENK